MNFNVEYTINETPGRSDIEKVRIFDARNYSDAAYRAENEFRIMQKIASAEDGIKLELKKLRITRIGK